MPEAFSLAGDGCTVSERRPGSVLVLRLRGVAAAQRAACADVLGAALPEAPNHATGTAPRLFWLAPGEWMIVDGGDRAAALAAATGGATAHLADVTAGRTRFDVTGPRARDLLAKGTSLDLHPAVFGAGRCARTLFAQIPLLVDRGATADGFALYADISLADYLRRWFADALIEFRESV